MGSGMVEDVWIRCLLLGSCVKGLKVKEKKESVCCIHGFRESKDKIDRNAMWSVLEMYGVNDRLLTTVTVSMTVAKYMWEYAD